MDQFLKTIQAIQNLLTLSGMMTALDYASGEAENSSSIYSRSALLLNRAAQHWAHLLRSDCNFQSINLQDEDFIVKFGNEILATLKNIETNINAMNLSKENLLFSNSLIEATFTQAENYLNSRDLIQNECANNSEAQTALLIAFGDLLQDEVYLHG